MVKIIDKPRQLIKTERGNTHKMVYLFGHSKAISAIATKRLEDQHCRQSPKKAIPNEYHVRVRYALDLEGVVWVQAVWVAFEPDRWTCFYDGDTGKSGTNTYGNGFFHSYYLNDVEGIEEVIRSYEEKQIIRQLAKLGPDVFAKKRVE